MTAKAEQETHKMKTLQLQLLSLPFSKDHFLMMIDLGSQTANP